MNSSPYEDPSYAAVYDRSYLLSAANAGHTAFEIDTVERIVRRWTPCRWLDVGCGTGYHLKIAQCGHVAAVGHLAAVRSDRTDSFPTPGWPASSISPNARFPIERQSG